MVMDVSLWIKIVNKVVDYILNQKNIIKQKSFQEEFFTIFENYEIEFDEKYVWDWFLTVTSQNQF